MRLRRSEADIQAEEEKALAEIIGGITFNRSAPDGRTPEGLPFWCVRANIPMRLPVFAVRRQQARAACTKCGKMECACDDRSALPSSDDTQAPAVDEAPRQEREAGEVGEEDEGTEETEAGEGLAVVRENKKIMIEGIASSTSVDTFGTEMSPRALNAMRNQFASSPGVPYLPEHGGWWDTPEWDDVIGYSRDAKVEPATVENGHPGEQGYVLRVWNELYARLPLVQDLVARVEEEQQPIGQSVGGWFTEIRVIYNEESGDVERVIVDDVRLDHLALTRHPSNPDSMGLSMLRARARDQLRTPINTRTNTPPVTRSAGGPDHFPLDVNAATRDDSSSGQVDARSSAPGNGSESPAPGAAMETDMNPDQIAEIVRAAIAPLAAKIDAIDARTAAPAQVPAPVVTEARTATPVAPKGDAVAEAEARAAAAEARAVAAEAEATRSKAVIDHLSNTPQRRGLAAHGQSGKEITAGASEIVTRAKAEGHTALVTVFEARKSTLEDDKVGVMSRGSLEAALRSVCVAAEADGLLVDPEINAGWGAR